MRRIILSCVAVILLPWVAWLAPWGQACKPCTCQVTAAEPKEKTKTTEKTKAKTPAKPAKAAKAEGKAKSAVSPPAKAKTKANTKIKTVSVRYLRNDVVKIGKDAATGKGYFVIRSAVEITAPGNRWLALDVEFRLGQAIPLVRKNGKMLTRRWNNLFTPDTPSPARWTNCRLDVDFAELQAAENLPKGKTFTVWAMAVIWNYAEGKYVGSGWSAATPLTVTTDKAGKIIELKAKKSRTARPQNAIPPAGPKPPPTEKKPATKKQTPVPA
ncbi:MAG: hypothetical protein K8S55_07225 [Phycisphaerae bacterium]|nr:hypothetical protein [Phycisphaerae bacterium]